MLKTIKRPQNIYLALWIMYHLHGALYSSGSIISQSILMLALYMSVYYFYKVNTRIELTHFIKALNCFLVVLTIYGIIYMVSYTPDIILWDGTHPAKIGYLKRIYVSMFPIYGFYYFSKKGLITDKWVRGVSVILVIYSVVAFYGNQAAQVREVIESGYYRDEFTNNEGYTLCAVLPLLFLWRNKIWVQYILLFTCVVFVVMAMKRGAIIITGLCVCYFLYKNLHNASRKQKFSIFIISFLIIIIGAYFIDEFIQNSEYFNRRIEATLAGDSNGRDKIYSEMLNYYLNKTTFIQFMFGSGADYTIAIYGNYAHNDWLELAVNNGLLGIILYVFYFVSMRHDSVLLWKQNQDYASVSTMACAITFLTTITSMSYASLRISTALALGYCLGQIKTKRTLTHSYKYND